MKQLHVHPSDRPLRGEAFVPGDKSIGHRALLVGALCSGPVEVRGLSPGEDNARTRVAIEQLGARVERSVDPGHVIVHGVGLEGLRSPSKTIDCGNSGTTMRLLCGLLAPRAFSVRLIGDESLSRRPMGRVAGPLRDMGAIVDGRTDGKGGLFPPLTVGGLSPGAKLRGIELTTPVASAQVKSAILLAGLLADGPVVVHEPGPSRDHTERLLAALGAPLWREGRTARLDTRGWDGVLHARPLTVPGDLSSAAFLLGAALVVPGSEVTVPGVGINPTRTGVLDALRAMGAEIEVRSEREVGGEPVADLCARSAPLHGALLAGELVVRAIDEIPLLAALATVAEGVTEIRDAEELRVKESDRIAAMVRELRALGADLDELPDGFLIRGRPGGLHGGSATAHLDHRVAMSCAVAGLRGQVATEIDDVANVDTSFPSFADVLRALGARVEKR